MIFEIFARKGIHGSSSLRRRGAQLGHDRGGPRRNVRYFKQVQIFRDLQGTGETAEAVSHYTATRRTSQGSVLRLCVVVN